MAPLPRIGLALAAFLAIVVAVSGYASHADPAQGKTGIFLSDSAHGPWADGKSPPNPTADMDDGPVGLAGAVFAQAPRSGAVRRLLPPGSTWREGYRRFFVPFKTGPPTA